MAILFKKVHVLRKFSDLTELFKSESVLDTGVAQLKWNDSYMH